MPQSHHHANMSPKSHARQGATYKALVRLPGASKSQIWASILKDQEIIVSRIGQAKSVLWTYNFQYKQK